MDDRFTNYRLFTDRSRRVIRFANQEMIRLNQGSLHTGHILHGLIREGEGLAAHVLRDCDINSASLKSFTDSIELSADECASELSMFEGAASGCANKLRHKYFGTEHLLLGICTLPSCTGAKALTAVHASPDEIGKAVLQILGHFGLKWADLP